MLRLEINSITKIMKKQTFFSVFNVLLTAVLLLFTSCISQNALVSKNNCGALIAPGEWKEFMCHNLGAANPKADPFTPSWEIVGGYWQWGRKEMAASGPLGPGSAPSNTKDGEISGWNDAPAPDGSWSDNRKTSNGPCPTGFRVPTRAQWDDVLENNAISRIGTWEISSTNYSSGLNIGDKLFLPAAGERYGGDGALSFRGRNGYYWSSTVSDNNDAWYMYFNSSLADTDDFIGGSYGRSYGLSVRCVAE